MILKGKPDSDFVFIQMVDEHDAGLLDSEAEHLQNLSGRTDWCIAAVPVENWKRDLTPWEAPPVFGKEGFGNGAQKTLDKLLDEMIPDFDARYPSDSRRYMVCGYSLAGLFALWAGSRTGRFAGIAAASPSVWYPDWLAYAKDNPQKAGAVYLSLGDKEERARNPVMATVGNAIREQQKILDTQGVRNVLEWNPGNHFRDSDLRMAKGMAWMLGEC